MNIKFNMPKEKKEVKEEVKEVKVPKQKVVSATVLSGTGNIVRTYTEERHSEKGKSFVEKAEGYAKKIGGTVRLA